MVSHAAVFIIRTAMKIVLGLSFGSRTILMTKKRIIYTYLAANVRRSLPIAKSSTKITASPKTISIKL
jgi:hypothetical protein